MTVSFHKYGEYFPGTGDLMVRDSVILNKSLYYELLSNAIHRILGMVKGSIMLSTSHLEMALMMRPTKASSNQ